MEESRGFRIARNTILLYGRMLLSMIVTLYTSRVVLNALGACDYGIYNVVTGFVVSFGFLNSAMHASVQRFLTVEMKENNHERLNQIFSMGVTIHLILAFAIIIIAEPVGLYFVKNKLVIPIERMESALWIFHLSIVVLFFGIMNVPYKALIIARERMGAFAAISLIEVFAKLVIAIALVYSSIDKLILYGFLLMVVAVAIQFFYMWYCISHFEEGNFKKFWDTKLFQDMSSFAGWNLIGVFAGIVYNQGVNVVLNIFGGPIVNAARAIAFQVSGAANQLVTNFQLAANPPIMKAYATKDKSVFRLLSSSSKLSYILLLYIVVPFILECPYVLKLWLKEVPEYSIMFTRLAMVDILVCCLAGPLHTLMQATGSIKKYQMTVSGVLLMNLPISYLMLKMGLSYDSTFYVSIMLSSISLIIRYVLLRSYVDYAVKELIFGLAIPIAVLTIVSAIIPVMVFSCFEQSFIRFFSVCISSWVSITIVSWICVLDRNEKSLLLRIIKRK